MATPLPTGKPLRRAMARQIAVTYLTTLPQPYRKDLLDFCAAQGLDQWLTHSVLATHRDDIRAPISAALKSVLDRRRKFEAIAIVRLKQLRDVLLSLARQNIEVVVFKGFVSAARYWGDLALRPMDDIDLLVRPTDQKAAIAVLEQLGFHPDSRADPHPNHIRLAAHHALPVELHVDLGYSYGLRFPTELFWKDVVPLPLDDFSIPAPGDSAHIFYLLFHLAKHAPVIQLKWLLDLFLAQQLLASSHWGIVDELAIDYRLNAVVVLSQRLCHHWLAPWRYPSRVTISAWRSFVLDQVVEQSDMFFGKSISRGLSTTALIEPTSMSCRFFLSGMRRRVVERFKTE